MKPCSYSRDVDRHFAGALGPRRERPLRDHLTGCADCRTRYDRWLLLSRLDPRGVPVERRLAIGLGLSRAPRRWIAPAFAACAAVALAALVLRPARDPGEFRPRGGGAERLVIYRVAVGSPPAAVRDRIRATDELAFAFDNPLGRRRLAVFGVDEHRHIVWYHPSWIDPALDPAAVPIGRGGELREAIRHDLDGRRLTIYGVFTDEAITVHQVERAVQQGGDLGALGAVDAVTLAVEQP